MRKAAAISRKGWPIAPKNLAKQFIKDVGSGALPSCSFIKQAVTRHVLDLDYAHERGFYFDEAAGLHAIELFSLFRHTSGQWAKQPFKLQSWQAFLIYCLFGWKKKGSDLRRFTKAYVEVAKKNGKSELAAGIALVGAFFDGEYGAEVYSAANKLDQASICWRAGVQMAKFLKSDYPEEGLEFEVHESFNNRRIFNREDGSFFAPVASDSKTLDGLRPHFAIVDEYHEAVDDAVLRNLESGTVSRTQPLIFVITTAGFNRNGPCFQMRKVVADILQGHKQDDSFFGMIFTLDEGDDWEDEKNWIKSNPSIGITPTWDAMRSQYVKAKNEGETARINFLTKNLNIWTTVSKTWIRDEDWMANYEPIDLADLVGRKCYGGLDLALTRDITAFVLFFPARNDTERHVVLSYFFIPDENAERRSREDGVPYLQWIADGLIETTPGNATDYDFVEARIIELSKVYSMISIGYDAAFATQLAINLTAQGLVMDRVAPGPATMGQVLGRLENLVIWKPTTSDIDAPVVGKLNHLNNPVLRWMIGNVVIKKDAGGRAMLDKAKAVERIDGVSALSDAMAQWMTGEKPAGPSKYETEGITIIR